jgi:hypothetical protein
MQGDVPCCPGLTAVKYCDFKGTCYDDFSYCLPCGNGVCDELENKDNCAIDCAPETLPAIGVEEIIVESGLEEAEPLPEVKTEEKIEEITKQPIALRYKLTPAHATILVIGVIILILFILIVLYLFKKKH